MTSARYSYLRVLNQCNVDNIAGPNGQSTSIEGASNAVSLATTGAPVSTDNNVPAANEVLTATGVNSAEWQNYSPIVGDITMPTNAGSIPANYPQNNRMTINTQGLVSNVSAISTPWGYEGANLITPVISVVTQIRSKKVGDVGYIEIILNNLNLSSTSDTFVIDLISLSFPVGGPYYGTGCYRDTGLAFESLGLFAEVELNGQILTITSFNDLVSGTAYSFRGQVVYRTTEP